MNVMLLVRNCSSGLILDYCNALFFNLGLSSRISLKQLHQKTGLYEFYEKEKHAA